MNKKLFLNLSFLAASTLVGTVITSETSHAMFKVRTLVGNAARFIVTKTRNTHNDTVILTSTSSEIAKAFTGSPRIDPRLQPEVTRSWNVIDRVFETTPRGILKTPSKSTSSSSEKHVKFSGTDLVIDYDKRTGNLIENSLRFETDM